MNEQIKKLAGWAGFEKQTHLIDSWECGLKELERFAELVRQDEREANAKLLDDFAKTQMVPVKDTWRMGVMAAANAVRDKK